MEEKHLRSTILTEVRMLVHHVKNKYPNYKFYLIGSCAMRTPNFNDYDIGILPPTSKYNKEWSYVLKNFDNKKINGKKIDAQIMPSIDKLINLNAKELNEIKNNIHFKYFYCTDKVVKDTEAIKLIKLKNNMWLSLKKVISNKNRQKNLHNFPYISEEL